MNNLAIKHSGDRFGLKDFPQACISKIETLSDEVKARGFYPTFCFTPKDGDLQRIIELRDIIIPLETNPLARAENWDLFISKQFNEMRRELDSIELVEKWRDVAVNLIPTVGRNNMLDNHFRASAYTAAWYISLIATGGTPAAGDTMASHAGWTEDQGYSESTRVAPSFSAASASSITTAANVAMTITGSTRNIYGIFINSVSTKGGTTGTLTSAGGYTGGEKNVAAAETLNSGYTSTLT